MYKSSGGKIEHYISSGERIEHYKSSGESIEHYKSSGESIEIKVLMNTVADKTILYLPFYLYIHTLLLNVLNVF